MEINRFQRNVRQLHNLRGWEFHKTFGGRVYGGNIAWVCFPDEAALQRKLTRFEEVAVFSTLPEDKGLYTFDPIGTDLKPYQDGSLFQPLRNEYALYYHLFISAIRTETLLVGLVSTIVESSSIDLIWMARTPLELIGQSGLGYSFDNMYIDEGFRPLPLAMKLLPTNVRTFIMNITPWKILHDVRDMVFCRDYEKKKRALEKMRSPW
ncbi:hypothetical protein BT96DRAFT_946146 [Gymnopus androsaceus JB14]|uniref:Uncharacterized protein n=1 Tax=Gymnopus androsaceus JB14 TaxID=1447944 RepID=A0A6A4GXA2_9AGAR|nr:hypothetical protein BT96DRAFT_946146 [Gymnopus androsaceus JB14]